MKTKRILALVLSLLMLVSLLPTAALAGGDIPEEFRGTWEGKITTYQESILDTLVVVTSNSCTLSVDGFEPHVYDSSYSSCDDGWEFYDKDGKCLRFFPVEGCIAISGDELSPDFPGFYTEFPDFFIKQAPTTYAITDGTAQDAHGSISFDKATAAKDDTVTVTVTSDEGYQLKSLSYVHEPSAWSVIGDFTSWTGDIPMAETESGVFVSPVLTLSAGNQFKVRKDAAWDVNFGAADSSDPYAVTLGTPAAVSQDGKNMTVSSAGSYVVTLNTNNKTITVTSASTSVADPVAITKDANDKYTFEMPAYPVAVTAEFEAAASEPTEIEIETVNITPFGSTVFVTLKYKDSTFEAYFPVLGESLESGKTYTSSDLDADLISIGKWDDWDYLENGTAGTIKLILDRDGNATYVDAEMTTEKGTYHFSYGTAPSDKCYAENKWDGGDWTWKEMTKSKDNIYMLEDVVFGGTGFNINTKQDESDAKLFFTSDIIYEHTNGEPYTETPKIPKGTVISLRLYKPSEDANEWTLTMICDIEEAKTFDLAIIQAIPDGTKWTDDGAKVAAWIWNKDNLDFDAGWTDWATNTDGVLTLKITEGAEDIIFVRNKSDATKPDWALECLNRIDAGKIDESRTFIITDSNKGEWKKTVEIKDAEFYYSDAGNNLGNFYGGNEDYSFDLFVQTDTVKGDFKDAVDLKDSYIETSDGKISLLKVYSFSVTGEGKDLTLTASVLGSDYNPYDISATGYDGYIQGDAVDGCDIEFAADEISVKQIKIDDEDYISIQGENAGGDSMEIAVKGELDDGKLPVGTYTDIAACAGFTDGGTLTPSYIGNNSGVWYIQSGTLTVAADGSMEFEGLNSHGETVAITIPASAPAPAKSPVTEVALTAGTLTREQLTSLPTDLASIASITAGNDDIKVRVATYYFFDKDGWLIYVCDPNAKVWVDDDYEPLQGTPDYDKIKSAKAVFALTREDSENSDFAQDVTVTVNGGAALAKSSNPMVDGYNSVGDELDVIVGFDLSAASAAITCPTFYRDVYKDGATGDPYYSLQFADEDWNLYYFGFKNAAGPMAGTTYTIDDMIAEKTYVSLNGEWENDQITTVSLQRSYKGLQEGFTASVTTQSGAQYNLTWAAPNVPASVAEVNLDTTVQCNFVNDGYYKTFTPLAPLVKDGNSYNFTIAIAGDLPAIGKQKEYNWKENTVYIGDAKFSLPNDSNTKPFDASYIIKGVEGGYEGIAEYSMTDGNKYKFKFTYTAPNSKLTAPQVPSVDEENVKAIMCDAYTNNLGWASQDWGSCNWSDISISGVNFQYAQTMHWEYFASDWTGAGVADYANLHFDIWFAEDGNSPIVQLDFTDGKPVTNAITIPGTFKAGWNSVNINIKDIFGEQPMNDLRALAVKVTKEGGPVAWANILFYNGEYTSIDATASQYKYTTYENWQIKHEGSEWQWTENLVKVEDGLFKLADANWKGSGFNVASDTNPIKKDWYDTTDPDVTIGEEVIAPVIVDIYLRVIDDETLKIGIGEAPPAPAPAKTPVTELELSVGDFTQAQLSSPPSNLVSITKITEGNEDITARPATYYFLDKNGAMVYGYDIHSSTWMVFEDGEFEPLQGTPDYDKIATAVLNMYIDREDSDKGDFADNVTVKVNGGAALAKANDPLTGEGYNSYGDQLWVFLRFDLPSAAAPTPKMPENVEVKDGKIKSGEQTVEVKTTAGASLTKEQLAAVAEVINATLDNKAVSEFTGSGIGAATGKNDDTFKSMLKALTSDSTAKTNIESAELEKYLEMKLEGVEIDDPSNPVIQKMTLEIKPFASAKVTGRSGEIELETAIEDSYIDGKITVRMPIDSKNDSKTAAVYDKNGKFLGNYDVKEQNGSKFIEIKTETAGSFTYVTLNAKTSGANIGGKLYATAADALSEIENGQTVTLTKDVAGKVSISKLGTFTVVPNGHTVNIVPGAGYKLTKNGDVYTVTESSDTASKMPENVEVKNGKIKSGEQTVEVKTTAGASLTAGQLAAVAEEINKTLDNKAVEEFAKSGLDGASSKNDGSFKSALKALTTDPTAQANLDDATIKKYIEMEIKGAEVDDPSNPVVQKMTVEFTPFASAQVAGSTGTVEIKTEINDSDIEGSVVVRMPVDSKNDSKTAAVYDENGKFLGNYDVKIEDGSKFIEIETETAGSFTYITLNAKTSGANIDGKLYATVEDALSEIEDGQTVTLTKNVSGMVTINKPVTFTVVPNGHTVNIEAGKGLKLTKSGNTYTVTEIGSAPEMPEQTEVVGGEIKSGDTVVEVKSGSGASIPDDKKQAVAEEINKTLDNDAVTEFTKSGLEKSTESNKTALRNDLKAQTSDQTALANLATAEVETKIEMTLKGAEVDDPSNPVVQKMTVEVTPTASAKVMGSTGEVELKSAIKDRDIAEPFTVRMPIDLKNDSKTAAVYGKDGEFLGNFPVKEENGSKYVEFETKTAGEYTYITLNESTAKAKIGTKLYANAKDALSEVSDGETVTLTENVPGTVPVSKAVTFTVNPNGHTFEIVAGSGYTLTKTGNTYTVIDNAAAPVMPENVEVSGGNIKSGGKTVDVKGSDGKSIPSDKKQAVAEAINATLDNKAVGEFTQTGLDSATKGNDAEYKNTLKSLTKDKTAQANLENAKLSKRLEMAIKSAEVDDPSNPIVQKMTINVSAVASAKVEGNTGEVEIKTTISNRDIQQDIAIRMPIDQKNDSQTAAIYENGTFLGNFPVKSEDGSKFVEFKTGTTGEFSYITLNEKTSGASNNGTLYASTQDAVSEAKSGDTVIITKDSNGIVTVSKEITLEDKDGTHKVSVLPVSGYKVRQNGNKQIVEPGDRTEVPEKLEVKNNEIKSGNGVVDVKDSEGKSIPNDKKADVVAAINKVLEAESFEKSAAVGIEKATVRKVSEIVSDLKAKTTDTTAKNNITETNISKYLKVSFVSAQVKGASDAVVESMTVEVTPMATVTVKNRNGEVITLTSKISNEEINGTVEFNLPIDVEANAETVAVYHEGKFIGNYQVLEDEDKNPYVTVKTGSFSKFSYIVVNEKNAAACINGVYYLTLADAIAAVKDGETIKLLKNVDENITVEREVSFTIDPNGNTNNATIVPGEKFGNLQQTGNSFSVEAIGKPEMPEQTEVTPSGDFKSGENVVEVKDENGESVPDDKKSQVADEINNTLDNKAVKSFNQSGLEKATAHSDSNLENALKSQTTDSKALENFDKAELTKYLEVELKKVDVNDPSNPVVESMTVDVKAMASAKVEGTNGEIELKTPIKGSDIKEEITVRMPVSGNNTSDTAALYDKNGAFLGNYEVKEENGNKYIEFKTKNVGEFTYRTINEKTATVRVNGTLYAKAEDAISEIRDGNVIELTKDVKEPITVSKACTFTVNDNGYKAEIVAGSGYKLTKNGNTYTITKKSSGGSGGGGSSSYTVKFETNGGNALKNVSVKVGQKIGTIETPKKEGFVFDGWYQDKELTKPYNADDKVTKSTTLYANWKIDPVRQITLTIGKKEATVFTKEMANDVAPKIVNDRTMLPIRFVAEALGATVDWNGEKELVTISNEGLKIEITIGKDVAFVNGKEVKLDSPAFIENDRTYLPLRFVAENLGAEVEWVEEAQQVVITKAIPEKTTTK